MAINDNNVQWKLKKIGSNPTDSNMVGATSTVNGRAGLVPIPVAGNQDKYLRGDGTWSTPPNASYTNASLGSGYGTCSTAEATVAKVVTLPDYALMVGGSVSIKFTYKVPASATLNINSKGAKPIYYKGLAITANIILAGDTATFVYDGTNYNYVGKDMGVVPITNGGTGATSASSARTNLGLSTAFTGASISGKVITLTKADGTTTTLTTQDTVLYSGSATSIGGASETKPAVVVQSYRSNTSWYRVWSDGWIEQGSQTSGGTNVTVTFPKAFSTIVCSVVATKNRSAAKEYPASVNNVTTTGMTICSSSDSAPYYWYACGY